LYVELYNAWQSEEELQPLPENFYSDVATYLKSLMEEVRGLDEQSLKAQLKRQELDRANYLVKSLILRRFRKMISLLFLEGKGVNKANLSGVEKVIYNEMEMVGKKMDEAIECVVSGSRLEVTSREHPERVLLRFLQEVPALVGVDMKTYGPFKVEDVALIPVKNVESLIRGGFVKRVDIR